MSEDGRQKIMRQLGEITAQLSHLRFSTISSLVEDEQPGAYKVEECLLPSFIWFRREELEELDRGPFHDERDYFDSLFTAYINHFESLDAPQHLLLGPRPETCEYNSWASYAAASDRANDFVAVGIKMDHSKNRFAFCLAGQLMKDMTPQLISGGEGFPLHHPDLHTGNIFVDDDLNVTCIIDWASASTVPSAEHLITPCVPSSALVHKQTAIAAFRQGYQSKTGVVDGETWKRADMMWRVQKMVRMHSAGDYHHFQALCALASPDGTANVLDLLHQKAQKGDNRNLLNELAEGDLDKEQLREREQSCFGTKSDATEKRAVARKLTIAYEMNPRFLADVKLWRWLENALRKDDASADS
ncbi:hypothetical protein B0H63DRAFT_531933 [Podospora didyma]|uniref:Aminoglycoside phosphotransferase domain-containing protein n=1 Tax=Podospora didyma TaxID=330526 RepID=A0AAE0U7L4_9PEZI|nr:hypothetical protein B0H63DRAFT_531933 [Podospora didyma]